ncbi:MAG: YidC/Oxa1 family membrane protein insertase [Microthrixaceae bacterium]
MPDLLAPFDPLFEFFGSVVAAIYSVIPSFGVSIVLFTVLVMVVVTPLTVKSTKSMLQMQRLQPELKQIQAKYKGDRERLNTELMLFYKENNISPVGGCLPILAQAPVFIVMYHLIRGLTNRSGGPSAGVGHIVQQAANNEPLTSWVFTDRVFNPEHVDAGTSFYQTLSTQNTMPFFNSVFRLDLAKTPAEAWAQGLVSFMPYLILLLLILVIQVIQNRQIQSRNPQANANPTQAMLLKVMPFILPIFAFNFAGALAVYWGVQGLCRIATQSYITKELYGKDGPGVHHVPGKGKGHLTEKEADAKKGSKGATTAKSGGNAGKSNGTKAGQAKAKANGAKRGAAPKSSSSKSSQTQSSKRGPTSGSGRAKSGTGKSASTSSGGRRRSGEPRQGNGQRKN